MEAGEVDARWRHQRHRLKLHVRRAVLPRRLELVMHPAPWRERLPLLADRRACNLPAQAFELLALVRLGGPSTSSGQATRMQPETADLAGVAFGRVRIGWDLLQRRHLAPGLRTGSDAVGDRAQPQRV